MSIRGTGRRGAATLTAAAALGAVVVTAGTAAALWPTVNQSGSSSSTGSTGSSGSSSSTDGTGSDEIPGGSEFDDTAVPVPVTPAQPSPYLPHARTQGS
jgi:hypothetical protein